MTEIKLLNSNLESTGLMKTDLDLSLAVVNVPVVHQVVKAILAGRRQGTASTKNKAMVSGGGIKPYKQKGTGRARQGSIRSPLFVGGGAAFGPKPRCYAQKVNKKVAKRAILSILADKLNEGKLTVVEELKSNGKTKDLYKVFSTRGLLPALFIVNDSNESAVRAIRNLKNGYCLHASSFSVYEALRFENLIIEKAAFEQLIKRLG